MSHPSKVKLFIPWSKAMVAGATVGNPDYSMTGTRSSRTKTPKLQRRKRRRKRRKKNAKKEG